MFTPGIGENYLLNVKFSFDDLTNENILQKNKLRIKEELENKHYTFLFNTKPVKIRVFYEILQPPREEEEEDEEENEESEKENEEEQINAT